MKGNKIRFIIINVIQQERRNSRIEDNELSDLHDNLLLRCNIEDRRRDQDYDIEPPGS